MNLMHTREWISFEEMNLLLSDKEDMPETKEKKTSGTTINRRRFLNIWPPRLNKYFSMPRNTVSDIKS